MPKKSFIEIHYLRILACLMVILIHITATPVVSLIPNSPQQLFFILINRLSKPSVPIFIFISGFLLHMIYQDKTVHCFQFWKKRLPKLVIPYVLWATGYYMVYAFKGLYPLSRSFYFTHLLEGSFIYHLYFMVIIIQFYVLYPLFHFFIVRIGPAKLFIGSLAIQILLLWVQLPLQDRLITTYLSYFTLGILIHHLVSHQKMPKLSKSSAALAFLGVGLYYTFQYIQYTNYNVVFAPKVGSLTYILFCLVSCVTLYSFLSQITPKTQQRLQSRLNIEALSHATVLIYYAHPLIIILVGSFLDRLGIISISLRSLSAFAAILLILVPFAYWVSLKQTKPPKKTIA